MDAELVAWSERVRGCGDGQLMAELQQLVRRDRRGAVRLLMYLAEVDERRLFLEQGYSCLIRYATAVLRMSGQQAYLRIQAARLARRFPVVFEMLSEGAVSLSTLKQLDQHLTVDNHLALLERARNKTKDEVALLIAEIAPQDDVPTRMRRLPARVTLKQARLQAGSAANARTGQAHPSAATNAAVSSSVLPLVGAESSASDAMALQFAVVETTTAIRGEVTEGVPAPFALEAPRATCTPLRPGRFRVQLTANQSLHDKLMQLRHLLRHQVPDGDFGAIVERACDVLLEKTLKQRFAQVAKPRASAVKSGAAVVSTSNIEQSECADPRHVTEPANASSFATDPCAHVLGADAGSTMLGTRRTAERSRYVPRAVLREVFARDGGQCTFVGPDGNRCSELGMIEVHHVRAFAFGGEATVENLRLVCRAHNNFFAAQDFGEAHMLRKRTSSRISAHQHLLFPD